MIVVTGAAGHLGNALLRRLAQAQASDEAIVPAGPLRAVVRPGRDRTCFAGLDIEVVEADVRHLDSLVEAFRGAEAVFHLASEISIASRGLMRLRAVNVEGTRNVLEACRVAHVRRLVYASSVHAFAEQPMGTCTDEDTPVDPLRTRGPYAKTKAEATQLVLAAARDGLDVVVTFPSGIVGPYDFRPSQIGQLIINCVRRRLRAYVDGAYNFVDVRDVAEGLAAAFERGRAGEGYILSGNEVTVRHLLSMVEALSGVRAPRLRLNFRFTRSVSRLIPVYYWITRQTPLFTTYSLYVIGSNCSMSYGKAERELGFSPRPFLETIEDTIGWFRQQRMLQ